MKKYARLVAFLALISMLPLATGCFGSFTMLRKVYAFNRNVWSSVSGDSTQRKIVQTVVMWGMIIIPIYGLATLGDLIIFNLIEFWTGNPVSASAEDVDGVKAAFAPSQDGREATLTLSKNGKVVARQRFVRLSDGTTEVRDSQGNLLGKVVRNGEGGLTLTNAKGSAIQTIPAKEVASLR